MEESRKILVLNAGSSSIKAVVYSDSDLSGAVYSMTIEKIGLAGTVVWTSDNGTVMQEEQEASVIADYNDAVQSVLRHISEQTTGTLAAIGFRVVHGGPYFHDTTTIDVDTLSKLEKLTELDPEHMPGTLNLIKSAAVIFPQATLVACFDTAFFADLPRIAQIIPIPRKYEALGIRRYGFHGLSYSYLLDRLAEQCGDVARNGRIIIAHLGSGASLAAIRGGQPLDTTMGLSPASGIMMSTRSGDLDPGVYWQLHSQAGLGFEELNHVFNKESGLLGVSETSADMYELLENQSSDARADEAVQLFCYQVKKAIGSYAAVLGGVDTIIFAGGMGENAPRIRERVLAGLEYMGVELHNDRNYGGDECISTDTSRVGIHVFHTDESKVIAHQVIGILNKTS